MPTAPLRPCAEPGCPRLVSHGRCAQHQRAAPTARGYGRDWRALAQGWLRQHPWCGERGDGQLHGAHSACARRQQRVRATIVDHIAPLPAGARLDPANLQSLCVSCNTRKGGLR